MGLIYKLISFFCLIFISENVTAEQYSVQAGEFKNIQVTDSWNTSNTSTRFMYYRSAGGSLVGFTKTSSDNTLCMSDNSWLSGSGFHKVITIDGYTGIEVANGIILVPMNMNVSGSGEYSDNNNNTQTFNTSETSNGKGFRNKTGSYSNPNIWCSTLQPIDSSYTGVIEATRTSSGSINWGVYVSDNAASGIYNIPDIFIGPNYINGGTISRETSKLNGNSISVWRPMSCSIISPDRINFGKVNSWEWEGNTSGTPGGKFGDVLGVVEGNFTINCTGDGNTRASATLTLDGAKGRYTDDLKVTMDATGEEAPASVRVTIKDLSPPCSSGVSWGPVSGKPNANVVKLDDLVPGTSQVPYRFSLCSTGQGFKGGAASASATIKLDWE